MDQKLGQSTLLQLVRYICFTQQEYVCHQYRNTVLVTKIVVVLVFSWKLSLRPSSLSSVRIINMPQINHYKVKNFQLCYWPKMNLSVNLEGKCIGCSSMLWKTRYQKDIWLQSNSKNRFKGPFNQGWPDLL